MTPLFKIKCTVCEKKGENPIWYCTGVATHEGDTHNCSIQADRNNNICPCIEHRYVSSNRCKLYRSVTPPKHKVKSRFIGEYNPQWLSPKSSKHGVPIAVGLPRKVVTLKKTHQTKDLSLMGGTWRILSALFAMNAHIKELILAAG